VVLGGVVRASGSGLGCPDWPLCYGQPLPPAQTSSMIEFSHRALGAITSGFIIATTVLWARARGWERRVVLADVGIGVLLGVQILLGAVTVRLELPPMVVLAHLGLAMLLLGLLVLLSVRIWEWTANTAAMPASRALRRLSLLAAGAVYLLVLTGAYVRATGATWACL